MTIAKWPERSIFQRFPEPVHTFFRFFLFVWLAYGVRTLYRYRYIYIYMHMRAHYSTSRE
ncbi:hypothetical protein I7I50_05897 [Histoplasma capsulatum G186AR]|uniref:Uncharacterized protein n=1 Tax=Ajellomyces capsulatus TaxID=5037 RepID=A0A8H7Z7K2_AJECA|nr:hypothetical protein I7I52_04156 [Histoplasma capsulatum]QSS76444.1 hypothetical protein I7I50_05897 [Histoplasma capsulatum G186AR]